VANKEIYRQVDAVLERHPRLIQGLGIACFGLLSLVMNRAEVIGKDNLRILNNHLMAGKRAVVVFNHLSIIDPLVVANILDGLQNRDEITVNMVGSSKFKTGRMGPLENLTTYFSKSMAFNIFFVDPHYDQQQRNNQSLRGLLLAMKKPKSVLVIAPEGTRSRGGSMERARPGLGHFIKNDDCLILPIGLEKTEEIHRVGSWRLNPLTSIRGVIGPPILASEIKKQAKMYELEVRDMAMIHVAGLVEERYRGYYSEDNYPIVFRDQGLLCQYRENYRSGL